MSKSIQSQLQNELVFLSNKQKKSLVKILINFIQQNDTTQFYKIYYSWSLYGYFGLLLLLFLIIHSFVLLSYKFIPQSIEWNQKDQNFNLKAGFLFPKNQKIPRNNIQKISFRFEESYIKLSFHLINNISVNFYDYFKIPYNQWILKLKDLGEASGVLIEEENTLYTYLSKEIENINHKDQSIGKNSNPLILNKGDSPLSLLIDVTSVFLSITFILSILYSSIVSGTWDLGLTLFSVIFLGSSFKLFSKNLIIIDNYQVRCLKKGLINQSWQEPLTNYHGLELIEYNNENPAREIKLSHLNKKLSLVLYKSHNQPFESDDFILNTLSHRFNLPIIKNPSELSFSTEFQKTLPYPGEWSWKFVGLTPLLLAGLFFCLIGSLFMGFGTFYLLKSNYAGVLFILIGLIPTGVFLFLTALYFFGKEILSIDGPYLYVTHQVGFLKKVLFKYNKNEITKIIQTTHVKKDKKRGQYLKIILNNKTEKDFSHHLKPETQTLILSTLKKWLTS